jgi:uncharacterized membrane protein
MPSSITLGKSRIEALSDGVFSIAMTLLVLKLEVPELMHHTTNEAMLQQLLALSPAFMTYVITFMIAGGFWFLQHITFHFIRHVDVVFVWISLLFLLLVALLPFSAGLMSHLLVHPVSQLFYYGNQAAIALLLNVQWQYAKRKGLTETANPDEIGHVTLRVTSTVTMFAACLVTSTVLPMWSWVPIPLSLLSVATIEGSRRRKAALNALTASPR